MNKKVSLGITISLVAIASAITFILTTTFTLNIFNSKVPNVKERTEINKKIEEIDTYVRTNYNGGIDEGLLQDSIAGGYIVGLGDKYATYYSADEYQKAELADAGVSVGIGITYTKDESGYIRVEEVSEGTPAAEAGITAGDIIVGVNGNDVIAEGYDKSVNNIKGEEGTIVKLTIRRNGDDKEYQLARSRMEIITVEGAMLDDTIGYIKISKFNETTPKQFEEMLSELTSKGAKQMIFDLRNNGGGLLTSLSDILNQLLPAGEIATATYKNGSTSVIIKTDGNNNFNMPSVILTNSKTASCSELFTAAMRDFRSSQIVGTSTYGKGVMQNTVKLTDGSAISVTVATYQTTKSPCYDGIGIKPNFEVELSLNEEENLSNLNLETDSQLKKAIEVAKTMQ